MTILQYFFGTYSIHSRVFQGRSACLIVDDMHRYVVGVDGIDLHVEMTIVIAYLYRTTDEEIQGCEVLAIVGRIEGFAQATIAGDD